MKISHIIATLAIVIALLVWNPCVMAIKIDSSNSGKRTLETNSLSIVIEGNQNVPKFTFSYVNDTKNQGFKVQFSKVSQTDSNHQDIPSTNIGLSSLIYTFSDFVTNNDGSVDFNITSTGTTIFQFRIHVDPNARSFKFDTVISGVTWNNNGAFMQLCYMVLDRDSNKDVSAVGTTSTRASFGRGFFEIEPKAMSNNGNNVKAGLRNSGNTVCVEYEKWDGTLVHDPTLGFSNSAFSVKSFSALVMILALLVSFIM